MSSAQLWAVYFAAELIPHILLFTHMSFLVCFRGRKSLTYEATYTSSQPFGSLARSPVDSSDQPLQVQQCVSPVLALLELSRGRRFTGENTDAVRWLSPASALGQLRVCKFFGVITLNMYTHWSLSFPARHLPRIL